MGKCPEKKILIVDDGEVERKFISATVEKQGYTAIIADNGQAGFEAAKRDKPDLILLDLVMPGLNGKEVCSMLRSTAETKDIPIIFLTGSGTSNDVVECYEAGADYYLTKPISAGMLIKQIELTFQENNTHTQ